jgi:tartrate dehydrogenase/decarboxylase/D-malate dehydrogenase
MKSYRIASIPGDGVGVEIANEATRVLDAAADIHGFGVATENFDWSCDRFLETGAMMPEDALETLSGFDSIFLGCIGDANKVEDHVSLQMLLSIRKGFDQYVNLRPIKLYPGVSSPIATASPETVDILVIRENTEGEYSGIGGFFKRGTPDAFALQTGVFTWKGCERAIRYGFEAAQKRGKLGSSSPVGRVTNCTKSNALNYSMVFWDEAFAHVAEDYPDIETDMALVDAMTMWFVKNPDHFDVVVASNLFGDIITDLGAMLQGGMGFAAGGNVNPEGEYPSMFEPIHGSAPKYTGLSVVNPIATIEAVRMMLDNLGEATAAEHIEAAIAATLSAGETRTKDMGGTSSTVEMGSAVVAAMRASA